MSQAKAAQPPAMPIEECIERSGASHLCESLTDVFFEAAETDCYVTRALVEAMFRGLAALSEDDFRNMVAEVHDDDLQDWMWRAFENRIADQPVVVEATPPPCFGGTEEDLSDLRRSGLAR